MKTRLLLPFAVLLAVAGCDQGNKTVIVSGPQGPAGEPAQPTTAVEACIGCHGPTAVVPIGDITSVDDPHYVDTNVNGPLTAAGYRKLVVEVTSVDVTGPNVIIDFHVEDELGGNVTDLFASDGRFTIAHLLPANPGESPQWMSLITRTEDPGNIGTGDGSPETQATYESFGDGSFQNMGGGDYTYTSAFDPSGVVMDGDTMRVALQIDAEDIPAGNGWCDFDADTNSTNLCPGTPTLHRDIVQTDVCNGCHGVTPDVHLALHGGGRTQIEYCVTCHNPYTKDANSDNVVSLVNLIHKIHDGSQLANGFQIWGFRNSLHDYSTVDFTKDIDDCQNCHTGGGLDQDNWFMVPTAEACGTCHDDVNFATGENHVGGAVANTECVTCHPPTGAWTPGTAPAPVQTVHRGAAKRAEADLYTGGGNGFDIVSATYAGGDLTVQYSVTRDGTPADLENDFEWTQGSNSRLALDVAWSTTPDYTNEGSGSPPASAMSINALDVGGAVTALGGGVYEAVIPLPSEASDTVTVALEGHPAANVIPGVAITDRISVMNVFEHVDIEGGRSLPVPRRVVVDVTKCNKCHGAAGQGISLHGNNRTGQTIVCTVCHNPNNTDISQRPADPMDAVDGKKEQMIDFKRMIHRIHRGADSQEGLVIYGFGGNVHDFSHVEFIGNLRNCETCHMPGTYSAVDAGEALPTTIDTGADVADPNDDLNISPIASVCSACHDEDDAIDHMKLHGASFMALDANILR